MTTDFKQGIKIIMLSLVVGFGVLSVSAITPPTTTPGTVSPSLLNVSSTSQIKDGGLGVITGFIVSSDIAKFDSQLMIGPIGSGDSTNALVVYGNKKIANDLTITNLKNGTSKQVCIDTAGTVTLCP